MFKKAMKKKLIPFAAMSTIAISGLLGGGAGSVDAAEQKEPEIKNIIFLVGDGMGTSYTTAQRYMKDNKETQKMEPTAFDPNLVGLQSTYPYAQNTITDSAAAGTALATGNKTYNGAVSVDHNKKEVKTVLEQAKEEGLATGLVTTSDITDATPAAFGAHDPDRKNKDGIADDYYNEMINGEHKIDVILGGGLTNFKRDDSDLTKAFQEDGYSYVSNREDMLNDDNKQVLGLFSEVGMPKMLDRSEEDPSLKEMTDSALERLEQDEDGFFLMVEGSQIDWAAHDHDIVGAMSEVEDFERAYESAIEFAKKDKHTLVVATADHSTGGFTLGANDKNGSGVQKWVPEAVKAAKRTPDFMAQQIADGESVESVLGKYLDLELTKEEINSVKQAAKNDQQVDDETGNMKKVDESALVTNIDNAIERIIDAHSYTGWTTTAHTGEDVPVYAYGPGKEMFAGMSDNVDQAKHMFKILEENHKGNGDSEKIKFSDINEKTFGYEAIMALAEKGIVKGSNGKFNPSQQLTRVQAAIMLQRALDLPVPQDLNSFKDVDKDAEYAEAVAALKEAGIFNGYGDGTFGVNDKLSREQMASVLVKAFDLKKNNKEVNLADLDSVSPSHKENVKILYQNGITTGKEDGTYAPFEKIKRDQFSVFMHRVLTK
ncbi:alkaline phosphatase [Priestia endophytica]|uniref:alkaline phosphatase n=1 Tax=Priestia endophytica TaxID=135735 RepID=UPI003D2DD4CB